jgi:hypothetical protein
MNSGMLTYTFWDKDWLGYKHCRTFAKTYPFECVTQIWNREQRPDGVVLFVKINCVTREPLAAEEQDPIYRIPGVALDRGVRDVMLANNASDACRVNDGTGILENATEFAIHGSGFDPARLGNNGQNLIAKINNYARDRPQTPCETRFTRPGPHGWEWEIKGCIPSAANQGILGASVMAVGGNTMDECTSESSGVLWDL